MSKKKDSKKDSIKLAALSGAAHEVVGRYGDAAKQHYVAYSGKDNEVGKTKSYSIFVSFVTVE